MSISECKTCPHAVGDAYQRDCAAPECMGWHIEKNVKPIPDRGFDFDFWHDDYDGADGGNGLCGTAASESDAINQIMEIHLHQEHQEHQERMRSRDYG